MANDQIKARLEYLRGEIKAERISYGEIVELQSLAEYIEPGDVVLLEWAGVPENGNDICRNCEAASISGCCEECGQIVKEKNESGVL
ncbi:MAG: hypothetical protein WC455_30770 [Dehalococcoidia bacterium]|jgi:hypothetical protein